MYYHRKYTKEEREFDQKLCRGLMTAVIIALVIGGIFNLFTLTI